ncbi:hypothetical protein GM3708_2099 [Geminocystis sp. NIES-3708]|uniref:DUF3007 family protein n=1 Tax=Geminocystis sp. NIES-3708 TaxID=1615909 RepID=UPI0005FC78EB|nr:DUF3007 family protein [Geminocystis sp. NIES-3708]BAQ61693.1 hypothetical protein GM3708_2099 [Geminocystis sp. NIES-3708]
MRRIDAILIALGVFSLGGLAYVIFQLLGVDSAKAGVWSQGILILGLIGWVLTYLFRVFTNDMTYHQQVKEYEDAFFAKQLEKMSSEEIEKLMGEKD